jgi:trk system potassium uptake protein TrkH
LATGGFSTKNASIAAFDSPYIHYVIIAFMYLAGINFALHFRAVTGHLDYFKDHEWRFFTTLLLGAAGILLVLNLAGGSYPFTLVGVEQAFRDGLFQATAIGTTTGFVTADYELWVPASQMLIFILFFTGGMAGSTGGSMKSVRVLLLLKQTGMEIRKHLHPRAVLLARVGRRVVKEDILANVLGFVLLYGLLFISGAMVLALLGVDFLTALGASAASVGNIGPGLGGVGPTDNYGWMSQPALGVMSFLMLVGRLEIYTVLLLFHPEMWRRRKAGR